MHKYFDCILSFTFLLLCLTRIITSLYPSVHFAYRLYSDNIDYLVFKQNLLTIWLGNFPSSIINIQQSTLSDFFTGQAHNPYIVSLFSFASVCTKTGNSLLYVRKGNKR